MLNKLDVHFSSKSEDWETPQDLFDRYNQQFNFTLDVAASKVNTKCAKFFTKEDNGLVQDWYKDVCWMNPPYGRTIGMWIKKAYQESCKGATVVCLIPSRTDTRWWHDYCMKGEITFIKGRLKFINRSLPSYKESGDFKLSPAPFPSAIVIFRGKHEVLNESTSSL